MDDVIYMRSIKINVLIGRGRGTVVCAALTALDTSSVTINIINIIIIIFMKVGLKNIKQLYHALFQATG